MAKIVTKTFTDAQIDSNIVSLGNDALKVQQKIHNLAVSICLVWHDSKGKAEAAQIAVARLTALQNASPYHANAFSQWVALKLPIAEWSKENKTWYIHKKNSRLMGKVFTALRDEPFWMVAPAPKVNPMDLNAEIAKLIKKAEKRKDNPIEGDVIDIASLKFLRQARDVKVS